MRKLIIAVLLFAGCTPSNDVNKDNTSLITHMESETIFITNTPVNQQVTNKKLGEGVLVLDASFSKGFSFPLFNTDYSIWDTIRVKQRLPTTLKPYAYHYDQNLLVFRCVGLENDYNVIVVDEHDNLIKLVDNKQEGFKLYSWEHHILNQIFSVEFDDVKNPIRQLSSVDSQIQDVGHSIYGGYIYQPIKIDGEWLKIKWENDSSNFIEGWIKWKENEQLLLEIYYFA